MAKLQKRVETEMSSLIDELDKEYIRKMQADMYKCALNCSENETYSTDELTECVENCRIPLQRTNNRVQEECNRLQNRLQRCMFDCQDTIKDKAVATGSQHNMDNYMKEYEECLTKCVDNYSSMLPSLKKTLRGIIVKEMQQ